MAGHRQGKALRAKGNDMTRKLKALAAPIAVVIVTGCATAGGAMAGAGIARA